MLVANLKIPALPRVPAHPHAVDDVQPEHRRRRAHRRVAAARRPHQGGERRHHPESEERGAGDQAAALQALLSDGAGWSTSALALALDAGQRALHRLEPAVGERGPVEPAQRVVQVEVRAPVGDDDAEADEVHSGVSRIERIYAISPAGGLVSQPVSITCKQRYE